MKITISIILAILFSTQLSFGQHANANLLAQSPDGRTVKLIWFIKKWSGDITGFDIKRKEGSQDWVKLNKEPILPELSASKKISIVESDKGEESRIKGKLYDLLTAHNVQETKNKEYLQRLNRDEKAVQDIAIMIAHDYDLALMNGFAYVDHTVTKKVAYQYGLFIQGTNTLLASIPWNYGQIPDLNTVMEITSKAMPGKKGIQLIWNVDLNKIKTSDVVGFNIYREGIRLNVAPIVAGNKKDLSEYTWNDRSANSNVPAQYSISAESIFEIEGVIRSYKYDPADHPREYKKATVTEISSLGYYFKDGTSIKWAFPKDQEHFIKGFCIEKDNMPAGYKRVSGLLDPSMRSIVDTSASQVSGYIGFRVVALYNDRTPSAGSERLYNYFPVTQPPAPQNVKAKMAKADKKATISLSWDGPISGDSITDYYRVYMLDEVNGKLKLLTEDKPVYKTSFTYITEQAGANTLKFCVSSLSKNNVEGILSDTVAVKIPGSGMATPVIANVANQLEAKTATVSWTYPTTTGFKGFRISLNNTIIATEKEINSSAREFLIANVKLEWGNNEFTIQAVAEDGTTSDYAVPFSVNNPKW